MSEAQTQPQPNANWQQELLNIESALHEVNHQRQEAGNAYRHHYSEASRFKLRVEQLDAKRKELEARREAIQKEHSPK